MNPSEVTAEDHDSLADLLPTPNMAITPRLATNPTRTIMATTTLSTKSPAPPEVLAYRRYVTTNLSRGVDVTTLPTPSTDYLMTNFGPGPAPSASSPRGRVDLAFAEHFEAEQLAAVRTATEEYAAHGHSLARNGVALRDYVASSLVDLGVGMPPNVAEVLVAEQEAYATLGPANGLF